jgi:hypothetical protein
MQWLFKRGARRGSYHQQPGTPFQNGRIHASWERSAVALTLPCTASFSRGLHPKPDLHWSRAGSCANYASGTWIAVSPGQSGKVPNYEVPNCGAAHHPLLHGAIVKARAMIVKLMDNESLNMLQEAGVKYGGETLQMNVLYDWAATASIVTHQAADRAKQQPMPHEKQEVSGLNGNKSSSGCTYIVLMVDIAWMEEGPWNWQERQPL